MSTQLSLSFRGTPDAPTGTRHEAQDIALSDRKTDYPEGQLQIDASQDGIKAISKFARGCKTHDQETERKPGDNPTEPPTLSRQAIHR